MVNFLTLAGGGASGLLAALVLLWWRANEAKATTDRLHARIDELEKKLAKTTAELHTRISKLNGPRTERIERDIQVLRDRAHSNSNRLMALMGRLNIIDI